MALYSDSAGDDISGVFAVIKFFNSNNHMNTYYTTAIFPKYYYKRYKVYIGFDDFLDH